MLIYSSLISTAGQCQAQYIVLDVVLIHHEFFHVLKHAVRKHICSRTTVSILGEDGDILYCFNYCQKDPVFRVDEAKGISVTALALNQQFILSSEDRNAVENIF